MKTHLWILSVILLLYAVIGCSRPQAQQTLDDVAAFIEARPDSALAVLRSMPVPGQKALEAKQALLHSMALDKCYIDLKTDSILAPAINYFTRHGNADDRLKMCYYRARLSENAGDSEAAMEYAIGALKYVGLCQDKRSSGRLYSIIAQFYAEYYDYEKALEYLKLAKSQYEEAEYDAGVEISILDISAMLSGVEKYSESLDILENFPYDISRMNNTRQDIYYSRYIHSLLSIGNVAKADSVSRIAMESLSAPKRTLLDVARTFNSMSNAEMALPVLSQYSASNPLTSKYYLALVNSLRSVGQYEAASNANIELDRLIEEDYWKKLHQKTLYAEQQYKLEQVIKDEKRRKSILLLIIIVLASSFITGTCFFLSKIKRKDRENKAAKEMYEDLLQEKLSLEKVVENNCRLNPSTNLLLRYRIEELDKFLIERRYPGTIRNSKNITDILLKRDDLLETLAILQETSDPSFCQRLRDNGLSEVEIGFCTLCLLGITGKEMVTIFNGRTGYNISSEIRKKLGLTRNDAVLSSFLSSIREGY